MAILRPSNLLVNYLVHEYCQKWQSFVWINVLQSSDKSQPIFIKLHLSVAQLYLMDKYRVYDKIIKTKACTYFKAEDETLRKPCIIKKIHKSTTWQELLKEKDLSTMKNSKLKNFPAIHEIIKDDNQFYIIMEHMHQNFQFLIKSDIDKETIFKMGRLLIQLAANLAEKRLYPVQIRPSHLFIDQSITILKLAHMETSQKDLTKLDLSELQDLKYLSPEQILTTKEIDERSLVFSVALIICDLIMGKSLITANTKMQYIFELTRLFPDQNIGSIEGSEHQMKASAKDIESSDTFDKTLRRYNLSNQFIAMLKQMLKIDRSERLNIIDLLDCWDVVIENQKNFEKYEAIANHQAQLKNKPNPVQYPINDEIDLEIQFAFEQKPTISTQVLIKMTSNPIPPEKNVEDEVTQPLIIKKSKNQTIGQKLNTTKDSINLQKSVPVWKQPTLSTIRKPQLTNYAVNEVNLGVQMGLNPTIFSDHDI